MQQQSYKKHSFADAVSPVVGVMLMLVVTIIIAAVVSAFAGGLGSDQQKAPSISVNGQIRNDGTSGGSYYDFTVTGVDRAVSTKDIKIVTSWSKALPNGTVLKGGAVTTGPTTNETPNVHYGTTSGTGVPGDLYWGQLPLGFGPGINGTTTTGMPDHKDAVGRNRYPLNQEFGNFTLTAGTIMHGSPAYYGSLTDPNKYWTVGGVGRFQYMERIGAAQANDADGMQALLGRGWENLREGDTVSVSFIHTPSGKTIYNEKISVQG